MKGETGSELAVAAGVMREHMVRLETSPHQVLDTCGTGGDGAGTFNISTATALVAAAAGVRVVKHGNRAVSSRCGSADVLAALGVRIQDVSSRARECLEQIGLAFCFAPSFHPALTHISTLRQRLGVQTLFNSLGPLANPAGAAFQLLGVGNREWLESMAQALAILGTGRALLVCGEDGLDEVTLTAATQVREVCDGKITSHLWSNQDFGLPRCALADLRCDGPEESAARIQAILSGQESPSAQVVLANAAAALWVADRVDSLPRGVALASEVIGSGRARQLLDQLVKFSQENSAQDPSAV
jgi:anthranilate phosphoribosyltransferase